MSHPYFEIKAVIVGAIPTGLVTAIKKLLPLIVPDESCMLDRRDTQKEITMTNEERFFITEETDIEALIQYWVIELEVPEVVAREAVLAWKEKGGVTAQEQADIFTNAKVNYDLKGLVEKGLLDMTVDEDGQFLFQCTPLGREVAEELQGKDPF